MNPISRSKKKRKRRQPAPVQLVQEVQPIQEQPPARPESSMPKLNLDAPFLRERDDPLPTKMEEMPRRQQVFQPEAMPQMDTAPVSSEPVKPEKYEPIPYRQEERPQEQPVEQVPSCVPYREQEFSFRKSQNPTLAPVPKSKAQHGNRYQQKFRQPEQVDTQQESPVASDSRTFTLEDSVREAKTEQPKSRSTAQHRSAYQSKFHQESQAAQSTKESSTGDAPPRQKSKLEFSDDELPPQEKKLHQAQRKAEKTAQKLETAERQLPSKKKLRLDTQSAPETGKARKKLKFEKEVKSQASHVKGAVPLRPVKAGANAAIGFAHQNVYQVEQENVGTQAAHKAEMVAEAGARTAYHMHKTAPYRKVERLQKRSIKANTNAAYQQVLYDNPKFQSNAFSRMAQKRKLKRQYAKAVRETQKAGTTVKSTATFTEKITVAVTHSVKRHPILWLMLVLLLALMLLVFSVFSVFSNIGTSVIGGITSSSYLAEEQDIDQAEVIYTEWETDLKVQIENIPQDYPGYDEYHYDLDAIGHDPLQLMAYLTVKFKDFEYADVVGALRDLFNAQYTLTLTQSTETDPESGEDKTILNVKLTTKPFAQVIVSQLDETEQQLYELLMDTQGNRQLIQNVFGFNWQPYISSHYGYRIHPITGVKTFHSGVDIGMGQGTEILAGHDGVVSFSGTNGGYGLCVILDGSVGGVMDLSTKYAHCSQLLVSEGQEVKAGDVIAKVGSTGNSTGPHLHLEVLLNGQTVNPLYFADTGANESE